MVEPLPYHREDDGSLRLLKDVASLARAVTIASGLGTTSAYTWLKMPSCDDPEAVFAATTLPCVVLGGVPAPRPGRGPRVLGPGADPARRARAGRRPGAALPAGRRRVRRASTRPRGAARAHEPGGRRHEPAPRLGRRHRRRPGAVVEITPEDAGWDWTGLRVLRLAPGEPRDRSHRGLRGCSCCRWPGLARGRRCGEPARSTSGPRLGLRRRHRLLLRRPRQRGRR